MDFPGKTGVAVMAELTSPVSRWLLFLVLPMDTDVPWWDGPLQLQGGLGMWDGQGCVLLPLLHLEGPGSISSPDGAWCRQPSWLLSAQILGSPGFSLTEAPGGVLSHPWPTADPASCPRAVHFWMFPWFYCISSLQNEGLVFFLGLLFPVQRGWVSVACL